MGGATRQLCWGLENARIVALEERFAAQLRLAQHRTVLTELASEATNHPSHERFTGQLMTALSRCGRRADALAAYRRLCRHLDDELGLRPAPGIQDMATRIIQGQDPELALVGQWNSPTRMRLS